MKHLPRFLTSKSFRFVPILAGLLCAGAAVTVNAATSYYFDVNGTTAGSGVVAGNTYPWEGNVWTTSSGGTGTPGAWVDGGFPRFAAGSDATGSYTVTVGANHTIAGMWQDDGSASTLTINGPGNLTISSGLQGFFTKSGCNVVINANLVGSGGIQHSQNGGVASLYLYGTNTYSGGTSLNQGGGLNFNNNSSFGTGAISWNVAQQILACPAATAPITLPNAMVTRANSQLIFVSPTVAPVTFGGAWTIASGGTSRLTMNNAATKMIISGAITGNGSVLKDGVGTLVINGNASPAGGIVVTNGSLELGVSALVSGDVSVQASAGVLKVDAPTSLATTNSTLHLSSALASSVNLNFTGEDTVHALYIDGNLQPSGTYGAVGSAADNQSSIFTGTGILTVPAAPAILQQPVSQSAFPDGTATFTVSASGAAPLMYQWKHDGLDIPGANDSTLTISPVEAGDAGSYSVAITNGNGFKISDTVTLTILATNDYVNAVRADAPISYWRLDETNGTLAFDGIGGNVGIYNNVNLNQPGFSAADSDPAIGVPASTSSRGYVSVTNYTPFNFTGVFPFTLEAWANFTNFTGVQRIFSTLAGGTGYGFGVNGANGLRFTTSAVQDADQSLTSALLPNVWYHFVLTSDGSYYNFYVDGQLEGSIQIIGAGNNVTVPLQFGANPPSYPTSEQVNGRIDEVAIYNYDLSQSQIQAHYNARYSSLSAPIVSAPIASPGTNYETLTTTIQAVADGQALTYQWFKGSTPLDGQTSDTLVLSPLQLSDAGTYNVQVGNPAGTNTSPDVTIAVLPIPTNATDLNLTNGLVLHLPFDGDYSDISGRGNNGTNVGSTTFTSGAIGGNALHYSSDAGSSSYNYVTLGVRPDLQFGSTTNFTVSYWVRQPASSTYTNLPFFTDAIGSTGHGGFAFAPYQTATDAGGWIWTVGSVTSPNAATHFPDSNLINDGNWHHLVHVADRNANCTTYLDGVQVDSQSIVVAGSTDTGNAATIGQDPSGAYPVTAQADIDDLAVWQRTLSPLEISGIYLAGASNSVSFAPVVQSAPTPVALQIQNIGGQLQITWSGTGGVLQASPNVATGYTNVPSATSPYVVPDTGASQMFYRLQY